MTVVTYYCDSCEAAKVMYVQINADETLFHESVKKKLKKNFLKKRFPVWISRFDQK